MADGAAFHPEHCRAARALIGITQAELAAAADVARMTVKRFEAAEAVRPAQIAAMRRALEELGITFLLDGHDLNGATVRAGVAILR